MLEDKSLKRPAASTVEEQLKKHVHDFYRRAIAVPDTYRWRKTPSKSEKNCFRRLNEDVCLSVCVLHVCGASLFECIPPEIRTE